MESKPNTGWYDGFREWAHQRPVAMGILFTAFTLFFAWFAFGEMKNSDFYPFGSFLWAVLACVCAFYCFKLAYQRLVNSK